MSGGLARVISIVSIVLSLGGLGLAARSARREMRVRGGFDAARVLITFVVVIAMSQITSVSTPVGYIIVALALGAALGLYQGRNLTLSMKDDRLMARRTMLGIAVWGVSLMIMQIAAMSARTGAFRFGQALSYFSVASTVGLFLARNQRMQQLPTAAFGATAGVAIALLLAFPAVSRAQSTVEDFCADAANNGTIEPQCGETQCSETGQYCGDTPPDAGPPPDQGPAYEPAPPVYEPAPPVYAPPPPVYEPAAPPVAPVRRVPRFAQPTERPTTELVAEAPGSLDEPEPLVDEVVAPDARDSSDVTVVPDVDDANTLSTEETAGANGAAAGGAVAMGGLGLLEAAGQRGGTRGGRKTGRDEEREPGEDGGFWNRAKKKAGVASAAAQGTLTEGEPASEFSPVDNDQTVADEGGAPPPADPTIAEPVTSGITAKPAAEQTDEVTNDDEEDDQEQEMTDDEDEGDTKKQKAPAALDADKADGLESPGAVPTDDGAAKAGESASPYTRALAGQQRADPKVPPPIHEEPWDADTNEERAREKAAEDRKKKILVAMGELQAVNAKAAKDELASASDFGGVEKKYDTLNWVADRGVDILERLTGKDGAMVKDVYTISKRMSKGVVEAWQYGDKTRIAWSAGEAITDLAWSRGQRYGKLGEKMWGPGTWGRAEAFKTFKEVGIDPAMSAILGAAQSYVRSSVSRDLAKSALEALLYGKKFDLFARDAFQRGVKQAIK